MKLRSGNGYIFNKNLKTLKRKVTNKYNLTPHITSEDDLISIIKQLYINIDNCDFPDEQALVINLLFKWLNSNQWFIDKYRRFAAVVYDKLQDFKNSPIEYEHDLYLNYNHLQKYFINN